MKTLIFGIFLTVTQITYANYAFNCVNNQQETFKFELSVERNIIQFSDISYFGNAQILKNIPFGATISPSMTSINFEYNWYYTANYSLVFTSKPLYQYKVSDTADVSLSFDDHDGGSVDKEMFKCKRIN